MPPPPPEGGTIAEIAAKKCSTLNNVKNKWDKIPWGVKLKFISVFYFSRNTKQNIFSTFAILSIITEIKDLLK